MGHSTPSRSDILLDAGTNELEILVFRLGDGLFGVNVAKVREVIRFTTPTQNPKRHRSVLGMINLRGQVVPMVDLALHLGIREDDTDFRDSRVIIMEFNGIRSGYVVDGVDQIHRVNWNAVRPAPDVHSVDTSAHGQTDAASTCTGVLELNGSLVLMLDFESVADAILLEDRLSIDRVENDRGVDRAAMRVILAEDSPFMRDRMRRVLVNSGYTRLEVYGSGSDAWNAIAETHDTDPVHAVVSDIEMPQMDGLHLCKRIREHRGPLSGVPVVLFSSLISDDNRKKGQQVGATAQVAKPELAELVRLVDSACAGTLGEGLMAA
ncbi:MAG: chemotaxis protein CheV [Phycisphaerales bacterium]